MRAGDHIVLIARTQGALRALGEVDLNAELDTVEAEVADTSTTFAAHLFRWAGLGPKVEAEEPPPAPALPNDMPEPVSVTQRMPEPASVPRSLPELPMRQGTSRDGEALPETMSASQEREILWYAETHNDTDTARKYGLTRQRVTAMRLRMEREQAQRLLDEQSHEREVRLVDRPAVADVPRPADPAPPHRAAPPARPISKRPNLPRRPDQRARSSSTWPSQIPPTATRSRKP